jgi:hypothetical protein
MTTPPAEAVLLDVANLRCADCGIAVLPTEQQCPACGRGLDWDRRTAPEPLTFTVREVFGRAWQILRQQLGLCLALGLVYLVQCLLCWGSLLSWLLLLVLIPQLSVQPSLQAPALVMMLVLAVGLHLLSYYFSGSLFRLVLRLAQGQLAQFRDLLPGGHCYWNLLACSLVVQIVIGTTVSCLLLPAVIVWAWVWPYAWVMVADRPPGAVCLLQGIALIQQNYLVSLRFVLVSAGLLVCGTLLCGIGLLVVVPWILLAQAVAFCRMTGRPVAV